MCVCVCVCSMVLVAKRAKTKMLFITTSSAQTATSDLLLVQQGHVGLLVSETPGRTSTKLPKQKRVALFQHRAEATSAEELTAVRLQRINVPVQRRLRQRAAWSPRPPWDHLLQRRLRGSLLFICLCECTCLSAYDSPLRWAPHIRQAKSIPGKSQALPKQTNALANQSLRHRTSRQA